MITPSTDYTTFLRCCHPSQLKSVHEAFAHAGIVAPNGGTSFVTCPGQNLHTTANSSNDAKVYINCFQNACIPRIHCFHTSCCGLVTQANKRMMWAVLNGGNRWFPTSSHQQSKASSHINYQPPNLAVVLQQHIWTYQDIVNDAQYKVTAPLNTHHLHILSLYDPGDVLWIGRHPCETGQKCHASRFRTIQQWLGIGAAPGAFVCPSIFNAGGHSRSNINVKERKFFIVESDSLKKDEVGSVFRWFEASGYILRAIVDTGGKSLHSWYEYPPQGSQNEQQLHANIQALGCDTSMLIPSQPCRLPGAYRPDTGAPQTLIYFKP